MNTRGQETYTELSKESGVVKELCSRLRYPTPAQKYLLTRSIEKLTDLENARHNFENRVSFVWNRAPNAATAQAHQNQTDELILKHAPGLIQKYQLEKKTCPESDTGYMFLDVIVGFDALAARTTQQITFCNSIVKSIKELQERQKANALEFQENAVEKLETLQNQQTSLVSRAIVITSLMNSIASSVFGYQTDSRDADLAHSSFMKTYGHITQLQGLEEQATVLTVQAEAYKLKPQSTDLPMDLNTLGELMEKAMEQRFQIEALLSQVSTNEP